MLETDNNFNETCYYIVPDKFPLTVGVKNEKNLNSVDILYAVTKTTCIKYLLRLHMNSPVKICL